MTDKLWRFDELGADMPPEFVRYTTGVIQARRAYQADMKVAAGLCRMPRCQRKHVERRRKCWECSHPNRKRRYANAA